MLLFVHRVRTSVRKRGTAFPRVSFSMYTGEDARQNCEVGSRFKSTSCLACTLAITELSAAAASLAVNSKIKTVLAKPFIKMLLYECVVLQMRIRPRHAIHLFALAGRKFLLGVETPTPFEQSLAAQDFMDAGDASAKIVTGIEDGGVRVRDLLSEGQKCQRNLLRAALRQR